MGIFFFAHLHYKRGSQVDDIGVAKIGKLGVRKASGILIPQSIKTGFPKKIDKMRQTSRRGNAVIVVFKMIDMKKLDMLHVGLKMQR